MCHIVFQGYFDILMFVIYLDKYRTLHASGSEKYSTALVYYNTLIGVIVNMALCYCISNVGYSTTFKGIFSYTVLHSETYTYSHTELLHFLELNYGIGNIVLNWLLDNTDMHFVICTNFSQRYFHHCSQTCM